VVAKGKREKSGRHTSGVSVANAAAGSGLGARERCNTWQKKSVSAHLCLECEANRMWNVQHIPVGKLWVSAVRRTS
jgi:hypothetical protein